jgi:CBS domain-containing protein/anti-sigma regulatory factor (Ser/Thr protein kinase)
MKLSSSGNQWDGDKVSAGKTTPSMADSQKLTKIQELVYELKVRDAMNTNIITTSPDMSMGELRTILRNNRISGTPVVDDGRLVGIVSIEDFIMWLAGGGEDCPIRDKMVSKVDTICSNEPLIHAVSKLEKTGYGRMPVVDRETGRLQGIITQGDIIERLLHKLEIDYHEEEIHRYRASHIFEDIIGDKVAITFQSSVIGKDFTRAGEASSGLKKTLDRLGIHPHIVRRAAIASYEAEMNLVIYTDGGTITASVQPDTIRIDVSDSGPGIEDIDKAMQPGYSTASDWVRELGFGAGMGLVNIRKCSDTMELVSTVGKGTHLRINIDLKKKTNKAKAG